MPLRLSMAAHLVEDRALHIENAPIRGIRRMRAIKGDQGLLVLAHIGQRAAVGTNECHILWNTDGGLLEHGHGLSALVVCTQCACIGNCSVCIAWIVTIPGPQGLEGPPRLCLAARCRTGCANGAGGVAACNVRAAARGQPQNGCHGGRSE